MTQREADAHNTLATHPDRAAHEVGVVQLRGSGGRGGGLHGHEAEAAGAAGLAVGGLRVWVWVLALGSAGR